MQTNLSQLFFSRHSLPTCPAPPTPTPRAPTRGKLGRHRVCPPCAHAHARAPPRSCPVAVGRDVPIAPPRHRRGARLRTSPLRPPRAPPRHAPTLVSRAWYPCPVRCGCTLRQGPKGPREVEGSELIDVHEKHSAG